MIGATIQRSSVVERATVNRLVVGSNPTAGANAQHAGNELLARNEWPKNGPLPVKLPVDRWQTHEDTTSQPLGCD